MKKLWEQLLPDILNEFKKNGYEVIDGQDDGLIYVHRSTDYRAYHANSTHSIKLKVNKGNPTIYVSWSRVVYSARGTVTQHLQGTLTYQNKRGTVTGVFKGLPGVLNVDEDAARQFFYELNKIIECEYRVESL